MLVGAKTAVALGLLAVSLVCLGASGHLRADHLAQLDPWVTGIAAAAAVAVGTAVFRFWRLWERSDAYVGVLLRRDSWTTATSFLPHRRRGFVIGRGARGHARELPPLGLRATYVLVALAVALIPLDNRALAQLRDVPRQLGELGSDYCPEPEPPSAPDPALAPGCELVVRAYKLGYAKNLGDCAPREDDQAERICTLRQVDEPAFHYYWRLLSDRSQAAANAVSADRLRETGARLDRQLSHVDALVWARYDAITSAPRASHHLFTNLPDPGGSFGARVGAWLSPGRCVERTADMPHLIPPYRGALAPSYALEHALAQLLFNPAYEPVVGFCREYVIHWDARRDTCARLARDPEGVLADYDALDPVGTVLDRRRRKAIAQELAGDGDAAPPADRVVSFQCLMADPGLAPSDRVDVVTHAVVVDGHAFEARELRVPRFGAEPRSQIRLAKQLARLIAPGFGYGQLASRQGVDAVEATPAAAQQLSEPTYRLSRLQALRDADLFLGHEWIDARPDLLEVYPYHLHLANFIEVFREHYHRQRGRL